MKLVELNQLEDDLVKALKTRALAGDNEAAAILLEQINKQRTIISTWRDNKTKEETTSKKKPFVKPQTQA